MIEVLLTGGAGPALAILLLSVGFGLWLCAITGDKQ